MVQLTFRVVHLQGLEAAADFPQTTSYCVLGKIQAEIDHKM